MNLRAVAVLSLILPLAACLPPAPQEPLSCAAQGGEEVFYGMSGAPGCRIPAADAGQACTTGADCSGFCEADTMACSAFDEPISCGRYVDDNGQVIDGGLVPPCAMGG